MKNSKKLSSTENQGGNLNDQYKHCDAASNTSSPLTLSRAFSINLPDNSGEKTTTQNSKQPEPQHTKGLRRRRSSSLEESPPVFDFENLPQTERKPNRDQTPTTVRSVNSCGEIPRKKHRQKTNPENLSVAKSLLVRLNNSLNNLPIIHQSDSEENRKSTPEDNNDYDIYEQDLGEQDTLPDEMLQKVSDTIEKLLPLCQTIFTEFSNDTNCTEIQNITNYIAQYIAPVAETIYPLLYPAHEEITKQKQEKYHLISTKNPLEKLAPSCNLKIFGLHDTSEGSITHQIKFNEKNREWQLFRCQNGIRSARISVYGINELLEQETPETLGKNNKKIEQIKHKIIEEEKKTFLQDFPSRIYLISNSALYYLNKTTGRCVLITEETRKINQLKMLLSIEEEIIEEKSRELLKTEAEGIELLTSDITMDENKKAEYEYYCIKHKTPEQEQEKNHAHLHITTESHDINLDFSGLLQTESTNTIKLSADTFWEAASTQSNVWLEKITHQETEIQEKTIIKLGRGKIKTGSYLFEYKNQQYVLIIHKQNAPAILNLSKIAAQHDQSELLQQIENVTETPASIRIPQNLDALITSHYEKMILEKECIRTFLQSYGFYLSAFMNHLYQKAEAQHIDFKKTSAEQCKYNAIIYQLILQKKQGDLDLRDDGSIQTKELVAQYFLLFFLMKKLFTYNPYQGNISSEINKLSEDGQQEIHQSIQQSMFRSFNLQSLENFTNNTLQIGGRLQAICDRLRNDYDSSWLQFLYESPNQKIRLINALQNEIRQQITPDKVISVLRKYRDHAGIRQHRTRITSCFATIFSTAKTVKELDEIVKLAEQKKPKDDREYVDQFKQTRDDIHGAFHPSPRGMKTF